MLKKTVVGMIVVLALISFVHAGSGPDLNEGMWEITVDVEIPGMPMKMPPSTYTQCLKKDRAVPNDEKPGQACVTKDVTTKGNTVTWTMTCTNPGGQMTGKGMVTYHKDKMDGSMTLEGQGMQMVSHFKGHRIGACQ
jgi:hypothetical protein